MHEPADTQMGAPICITLCIRIAEAMTKFQTIYTSMSIDIKDLLWGWIFIFQARGWWVAMGRFNV